MELSTVKHFTCILIVSFLVKVIVANSNSDHNNNTDILERSKRLVFFPQYTVLQITMAIVVPMEVPQRKVAVNVGLQVNFQLPYTAKEFYKPPFWATRSIDGDDSVDKNHNETNSRSIRSTDNDSPSSSSLMSAKSKTPLLPADISGDDFYLMVQNFLEMQGFEEDCLAKAICEMNKHPLEQHSDNLMSELLHLILSPTQHEDLPNSRTAFLHEAERHGKNAGDCDVIYKCIESPLDHVTRLEEELYDDAEFLSKANEINIK